MNSYIFNKLDYFIWDAHACPTLSLNADLSALFEFKNNGYSYVSLNVGFEANSRKEVLAIINYFTHFIAENQSDFLLVKNIDELLDAKKNNKLAISFDIEGIGPLDNALENVELFYNLGVKQIAPVYNTNNVCGGGCFDNDNGLKPEGYDLVKEMNRLGILIDCSHSGYKTSLDIIENSKHPIIFSHSNPKKLCNHERNISEDLIVACAEKNGVIGLNGINIFITDEKSTAVNFVNQIDYIVGLVGVDHVGLGFDFVFEHEKTLELVKKYPENFPNSEQYSNIQMLSPNSIDDKINELIRRDYNFQDIDKILGGNFFRVASLVWSNKC